MLFRLRVEELIALVFLTPTTYLTFVAQRYAEDNSLLGARFPGGVLRLGCAVGLLLALALAMRLAPRARWVHGLRELVPFLACILIYTNLHDTIGFVNPHDVHRWLDALDRAWFGISPCLWAERFITPTRTEVMSLCYASFFGIAPAVPLLLLLAGRRQEFRQALLGIVTCFYLGYALYVALPAAPPRLYLAHQFRLQLKGYPNLLYSLSERTLTLLPADSRAAFPSLHAAVSLLALLYAWRYLRPWLLLLVPCAIGLWISTIYLRHHYFVDLVAGWLLAPAAMWLAPRLERFWVQLGERRAGTGWAASSGARLTRPGRATS
jgi:membrane-associated phospholipid phosphatase